MAPYQPKTPTSPGPDIAVRTLASDVKTLQESGGVAPQSQRINIVDMDNGPKLQPDTANQLPGGAVSASSKTGKLVAAIAGSAVVVVGLGLLGYYVVYPLAFPPKTGTVPAPVAEAPAPKPAALPHASLFVTAPSLQAALTVSDVTAVDIIGALQSEARNPATPGSMKELSIADLNGQVPAANYLNALLPEFSAAELRGALEDDFTAFLYYDDKGAWPGYVFKMKPSAVATDVQQMLSRFEVADISRMFLDNPGSHDGFKTGPVNGAPFRYAVFQKPGAAFDYGLVMDYVVVTTSYQGLKSALGFLAL